MNNKFFLILIFVPYSTKIKKILLLFKILNNKIWKIILNIIFGGIFKHINNLSIFFINFMISFNKTFIWIKLFIIELNLNFFLIL